MSELTTELAVMAGKAGSHLGEIAERAEKLAPEVWRVLLRQQMTQAVQCLIWAILLIVIAVLAARKGNSLMRDDEIEEAMPLYAVAAIFTLVSVVLLTVATGRVLNQEYYAAKDLIEMVRGK